MIQISINPGSESEIKIIRAAIYARVSTDDQAERGTIDAQLNALRQTVPHWGLEIVGEYIDDGVSGTLPLERRIEGSRMAEDAQAGQFDVVVFYKVDRLARSLRNFLSIVDFFENLGIGLRSLTEQFDTTTPMGMFAIQMMAAVAELERGTIMERTALGRARVAAQGRWTGGPVPYGFLLNAEGHLIPNLTPREGYIFSEAEVIQRIFREIADEGRTGMSVAARLNAEGIPMWLKYQARNAAPTYKTKPGAIWTIDNIGRMVRGTIYKGYHLWGKDRIVREVEPLVDADLWEKAGMQLTQNRKLSKKPDDDNYLLRGLIKCECGQTFVGARNKRHRYYRCSGQTGAARGNRCKAKMITVEWLEKTIWDDITGFINNPGDVLTLLQKRMTDELADAPSNEDRRRELNRAVEAKATEKDRAIDAYRHSVIELSELEVQLTRVQEEIEPLHAELAELVDTSARTGEAVGKITSAEGLLEELQGALEVELDWDTKLQVVNTLVNGITVATTGTGQKKRASLEVRYEFGEPVRWNRERLGVC